MDRRPKIDTLRTSDSEASIEPYSRIENLTYTGEVNFKGTGNSGANVITGGIGNDTFRSMRREIAPPRVTDSLDVPIASIKIAEIDTTERDPREIAAAIFRLYDGVAFVVDVVGVVSIAPDERICARSAVEDVPPRTANDDVVEIVPITLEVRSPCVSQVFNLCESHEAEPRRDIPQYVRTIRHHVRFDRVDALARRLGDDVADVVHDIGVVALSADHRADDISGGIGNDSIYGYGGDDFLAGNDGGNDLIDAGDGNDYIWTNFATDADTSRGGAGNDYIWDSLGDGEVWGDDNDMQAGNDTLRGVSGNDCLFGLAGNDWLEGGKGDDLLQGGRGSDSLEGGAGDDRIESANGMGGDEGDVDTMNGGAGTDTFVYQAGGVAIIEDFADGETLVLSFRDVLDTSYVYVAYDAASKDSTITFEGYDTAVNHVVMQDFDATTLDIAVSGSDLMLV